MEKLDLYDIDKKVIGTIIRGNQIPVNTYVYGCEICMVNNNGEILIDQRAPTKSNPLKWEFPGGMLKPGENSMQAIYREMKEEFSLLINGIPVLANSSKENHEFVDTYFHRIDCETIELNFDQNEISDYRFVDISTLLSMIDENLFETTVANRFLNIQNELKTLISIK